MIQLTGVTVHLFEPRDNPLQEVKAHDAHDVRQHGVAIFHTSEGIDGVVTALSAQLRQLVGLWPHVKSVLEAEDVFDRGKITGLLRNKYRWPTKVLGVLDYGLWDIAGKAFDQPIYKLLGGTRDRVPVYGSTMHHASDERFLEVVAECRAAGFRAIKIHPYCIADDDIRLCEKVRKAAGDDMTLMLDTLGYPGPYTRKDALRVGRVLDALNFWWFEDPLPKSDLDGLAELTAACKVVQVRMGDMVDDFHEYAAMIRRRCMHIVAGPGFFGISDLIKLAALAETFHMDMEPHDFGGGTASLHALLALPNARYYELAVPRGWLHEVLYPGLYIDQLWIDSEGCVHAPTKPGLGFDLDPDAAKRYTVDTLRA